MSHRYDLPFNHGPARRIIGGRSAQFTFGNASRTVPDVRNPGNVNYNSLNQVIFNGPTTSITSGDFGRIRLSQANRPRQIQFGLRFVF